MTTRDPHQTSYQALCERGWAYLSSQVVNDELAIDTKQLCELGPYWEDLPVDEYLRDGGSYRKRRHSSFIIERSQVDLVPHRAHWQPTTYNALHGGIDRWFEPLKFSPSHQLVLKSLLGKIAGLISRCAGQQKWFCEVHQFRIDTQGGIGRPTPEGAHRDGVDFVAIFLVNRVHVKGGETRVFYVNQDVGQRFTLNEPWSLLLMDDHRVIHETSPIQPDTLHGYRDTLVITFKSGGFLK
jgi:hypothetical protein